MIQIADNPRVVLRDESNTQEDHPVEDDDNSNSIVSGSNKQTSRTIGNGVGQQQDCFRTSSPSAAKVSTSSIAVILPEKFDPSLEILRSLSSGSMQAITKSHSGDPDYDGSFQATAETAEPSQIPRRNLTEAFEELYIKPSASMVSETETPVVKQSSESKNATSVANMISPTGVTELGTSVPGASATVSRLDDANLVTPTKDDVAGKLDDKLGFRLHPLLQRDLSDALVQRVSFYAIIHDINKEASAMAANDESGYDRVQEDVGEEYDPLVVAVQGYPSHDYSGASSMVSIALIDEEQWLLDAIDARSPDETRSVNACPPTFPQAMGERDYENPLASLSNGSRTQLWKPSRSWWEAKSGKNPWIEPKCHNKRWRYLWPLIHYHKFLAKCIKKLKRNGVDVKTSVSPVAVFLREEVCAVSDHLAAVSLFDSDEWMQCLQHFTGWTESDDSVGKRSRELVAKLKLRPLHEPGDVDSPLLRSQIDEQYLRAMASARAQLMGSDQPPQEEKRVPKETMRQRENRMKSKQSASGGNLVTQQSRKAALANVASPGLPPRHQWQGYNTHPGWWQNGWHHAAYPYADDGSVQSALSGDTSFSHGYMNGYHPGAMHHPHAYYTPMMYPQHHMIHGVHHAAYDHLAAIPDSTVYSPAEFYHQHLASGGWTGHSHMGHVLQHSVPESPAVPATPSRNSQGKKGDQTENPGEHIDSHSTPYKYTPNHAAMSPYWAHLQDHVTLSMMGLSTPQGASAPATPHHGSDSLTHNPEGSEDGMSPQNPSNAQPLLLRQQYYGYSYGGSEEFPPSPATQFMMSPQQNFGYGYPPYGSPHRLGSYRQPNNNSSISEEVNDARNDVSEGGKTTSESTPLHTVAKQARESPTRTEDAVSE